MGMFSLAASTAFLLYAGTASATDFHLQFTVSGFGAGSPFSQVSGDFQIKFDEDSYILSTSSGITVNSFSLSDDAVSMGFEPDGPVYHFAFGTQPLGGGYAIGPTPNTFAYQLTINAPDGLDHPLYGGGQLVYVDPEGHFFASSQQVYLAINGVVISADDARAVPEPNAWLTMATGFGILGAAMRGRTKPRFAGAILGFRRH